jgi:hypothetical protein
MLHAENGDIQEKYIGSTNNLYNRMRVHKSRNKVGNVGRHIYDKLENDFFVEILEVCQDPDYDIRRSEKKHIENCKYKLLNKTIPLRTKQEWKEANLDRYNKKRREAYARRREHYKKYRREWYAKNKDRLKKKNNIE